MDLAEKVIKKVNSNLKIEFKPLPQDDPLQRKPDLENAKKNLDWKPNISLDEGLDKTIEYFKNL